MKNLLDSYKKKSRSKRSVIYLIACSLIVLGVLFACADTKEDAESATNEDVEKTQEVENIDTEEINNSSVSDSNTENITNDDNDTEALADDSTFSIWFIDVGQGDAALVECDGHYMLIDGGDKDQSSKMYSFLKNNNIDKLDIVVATHAHADHIGGLPGALNYATADLVLSPVDTYDSEAFNDFKKYADKNGNGIVIAHEGDTFKLGSADIEILAADHDESNVNNTSIVLLITYGENRFLFTGDAEYEVEQYLCDKYNDEFDIDLLKVGHHGSDTSSSYRFIRMLMPEYAIISVGENNSYGHPTDAVLSRLSDADCQTYRTDLNGNIKVTSNGSTIDITTDNNVSDIDVFRAGDTYPVSLGFYIDDVSYSDGYYQLDLEKEVTAHVDILPIDASNRTLTYRSDNTNVITVDNDGTLRPIAEGTARITVESANKVSAYIDVRVSKKTEDQTETTVSEARDYVLNTSSMKFHYPSCKRLPTKNRSDVTTTREQLIAEGYTPCQICNP